jgi:hypothetical protein
MTEKTKTDIYGPDIFADYQAGKNVKQICERLDWPYPQSRATVVGIFYRQKQLIEEDNRDLRILDELAAGTLPATAAEAHNVKLAKVLALDEVRSC